MAARRKEKRELAGPPPRKVVAPEVYQAAAAVNHAETIHRLYTRDEVLAQENFIESLMVSGLGESVIVRRVRKQETLGIGAKRTKTIIRRIRERWEREDALRKPLLRAETLRRLQRDAQTARGQYDATTQTWVLKPNFQAVARFEELIADIAGTRAPIQVNVDASVRVSESALHVITALSPEETHAMLAEYRELQALAERAKRLPPAITVNGTGTAE